MSTSRLKRNNPKWAESAAADRLSEPDTERSNGYDEQDPLPHEHFNWLVQNYGHWSLNSVQMYDDLKEAVKNVTPNDSMMLTQEDGVESLDIQETLTTTHDITSDTVSDTNGRYLYMLENKVLYVYDKDLSQLVDQSDMSNLASGALTYQPDDIYVNQNWLITSDTNTSSPTDHATDKEQEIRIYNLDNSLDPIHQKDFGKDAATTTSHSYVNFRSDSFYWCYGEDSNGNDLAYIEKPSGSNFTNKWEASVDGDPVWVEPSSGQKSLIISGNPSSDRSCIKVIDHSNGSSGSAPSTDDVGVFNMDLYSKTNGGDTFHAGIPCWYEPGGFWVLPVYPTINGSEVTCLAKINTDAQSVGYNLISPKAKDVRKKVTMTINTGNNGSEVGRFHYGLREGVQVKSGGSEFDASSETNADIATKIANDIDSLMQTAKATSSSDVVTIESVEKGENNWFVEWASGYNETEQNVKIKVEHKTDYSGGSLLGEMHRSTGGISGLDEVWCDGKHMLLSETSQAVYSLETLSRVNKTGTTLTLNNGYTFDMDCAYLTDPANNKLYRRVSHREPGPVLVRIDGNEEKTDTVGFRNFIWGVVE